MKFINHVLAISVCFLLFACRSSRQEPVVMDNVKIDTLRLYSHSTDSVYLHDSIVTIIQGDTITRDRWHTLIKQVFKTDTIYRSRNDSIPVPYEVEKRVSYTPKYIKALAWIGGCSLASFIFLIIYKVRRFF